MAGVDIVPDVVADVDAAAGLEQPLRLLYNFIFFLVSGVGRGSVELRPASVFFFAFIFHCYSMPAQELTHRWPPLSASSCQKPQD